MKEVYGVPNEEIIKSIVQVSELLLKVEGGEVRKILLSLLIDLKYVYSQRVKVVNLFNEKEGKSNGI